MENPLVSIIIPVYNAERYLDTCITSVINQTYQHLDIVLVDDGSTDSSGAICDRWATRDTRIKVFHIKNGGLSHARNYGMDHAHGEYYFFLDADDGIANNAIDTCVAWGKDRENAIVIVNCDRVPAEWQLNAKDVQPVHAKVISNVTMDNYLNTRPMSVWGILFNRSLLESRNIRFDERLRNLEDVVWMGILLCYIKEIVFIDSSMYHYRFTPASITSKCFEQEWQAQCWVYARCALLECFEGSKHTYHERKHIRSVHSYCLRNFYAECFAHRIPYKQAKRLLNSGDKSKFVAYRNNSLIDYNRPMFEFYFYQIAFCVRSLLKSVLG